MPLFIGQYLRKTRGLSPAEHGVYLLLLMELWITKAPLTLDQDELERITNCRTQEEIAALLKVLHKYWEKTPLGWRNAAGEEIIAWAEALSAKRRKAVGKRWAAEGKGDTKADTKGHTNTDTKGHTNGHTKPPTNGKHIQYSINNIQLPILKDNTQGSTPLAESDAKIQAPSPAVIGIPLVDHSEFAVTQELLCEFEQLYPAVDVRQTLNEIRGWNLANPKLRKTRAGVLRHINQWLSKEQNRG